MDFSPRAIVDAKTAIAQALEPYDAIQTLAAIVAFSSFGAADTYSEPTTAPSTRMEYVAMVLLERENPNGIRVMTAAQTARAATAIQTALDHSQLIAGQTLFRLLSDRAASADPLDSIAAHLQARDSMLRGPGYEHQAKAFVRAAFADESVEEALRDELGFSAVEASMLEDAASSIVQRRHQAEVDTCLALAEHEQELAFQMQRRAEYAMCMTAQELADEADVSPEVASSFLERFSICFAEARGTHLLTAVDVVRTRPFVNAADGRFLLTSAVNLLWALPGALEDALKGRPEWEEYQARRSDVVEAMGLLALARTIRADGYWSNIRFRVDGGDEREIDGLIVLDDTCFVVEAKGGRLNRAARRGRKRELRPALEELVGRSASQAQRLARAISKGEALSFVDPAGAAVEIDLSPIQRVEAVVVTLEDLSFLLRHRAALVEQGLQSADEPMPWIVSAFELEIICQTLEFPGQLMLFLAARRSLPPAVIAAGELDLWMVHLLRKLEFPGDCTVVLWGDWTEEVDRYFMFGHGAVPRMPLAPDVRRQVERADRERRSGHLPQTEALIGTDQANRVPEPSPRLSSAQSLADVTFGPAQRRLQS